MSVPPTFDPPRPGGPGETERLRAGLLRLKGQLHDQITGLDSYHLLVDRLNSLSDGGSLGVVTLEFPDLAGLEAVYGFEMCDRFLCGVARLLREMKGRLLPESTLLALDGVHGDSFLLFMTDNGRGEALAPGDLAALSGQVRQHVAAILPGADGASLPRIECDAGYAMVCAAPAARFERRLSQAIREARGMTLRRSDRMRDELGEELRAILASGRLRTHYQPIVDMEQGAIMGYEALTRGPENSPFEGPDALFAGSLARQLLPELDLLCRCQALRNAQGFDMRKKLFLNSLPESLGSPGFADGGFRRALEESALQPRNLVLEITERTSIQDFEAFGRELGPLRRRGFLVAIDDVGTGYSSLQTITEVQPDFIKIDLSLIKNIHRSLIKQELVRSLLQVGSRIGAQVIAEGIETEDEYRTLRRCGVRYGQGFYLARPAPHFPDLDRGGR